MADHQRVETLRHACSQSDRVDRFAPSSSTHTPSPNPHSACPTTGAPPTPAISCLGAFPTPAPDRADGCAGRRRGRRIDAHREGLFAPAALDAAHGNWTANQKARTRPLLKEMLTPEFESAFLKILKLAVRKPAQVNQKLRKA